jgi:hypothetical protein
MAVNYVPYPRCSGPAETLKFTWGSVLGSKILTHVKRHLVRLHVQRKVGKGQYNRDHNLLCDSRVPVLGFGRRDVRSAGCAHHSHAVVIIWCKLYVKKVGNHPQALADGFVSQVEDQYLTG